MDIRLGLKLGQKTIDFKGPMRAVQRVRVIRNQDVQRALIGRPSGERHIRVAIELRDETLIFLEATMANLARGYHWVYDHPQRQALEMKLHRLGEAERKKGYAEYQLLETDRPDIEVQREIDELLSRAQEPA